MTWSIRKFRGVNRENSDTLAEQIQKLSSSKQPAMQRLEEIVDRLEYKLKNNFDMAYAAIKSDEILNEIKRLDLAKAGSISSILMERLTAIIVILKQIKDNKKDSPT